tara:strand:- start:146 stop:421 length:276 start_codon:yes stop_codon:yes gene_type:complete
MLERGVTVTQQELEEIIRGLVAVEVIEIEDMTGTQDHWKVMVVSEDFENKSRIDQHKLIFDPLQDRIKSNEIHALTLKTYTPEKWKKLSLS